MTYGSRPKSILDDDDDLIPGEINDLTEDDEDDFDEDDFEDEDDE